MDAQQPDTLETLTAAGTALASVDLVPPPQPNQASAALGAAGAAFMDLDISLDPDSGPDCTREGSRTPMHAFTQGLCP